MDFLRGNNNMRPSLSSIFNFSDISDKTQQHLTRVYTLLLVCVGFCALGSFINSTFIVSGFLLTLASIILSVYLIFQVANKNNSETKRQGCLAGLAF